MSRALPSGSPETRRFCCGRKSIAKWMPSRSRPGIGRSRGGFGAAGQRDGVVLLQQFVRIDRAGRVPPTVAP